MNISILNQPVCKHYSIRALAYTLVSVAISYAIYLGNIPTERHLLVVYALLYPHVATAVLFFMNHWGLKRAPVLAHILDATNLGTFLALCGLPPIETLLFTMMLLSTGIIRFGLKSFLYVIPPMVISIEVCRHLQLFTVTTVMPTQVSILCITIVALHACILARGLRSKHQLFIKLTHEAEEQQVRYTELAHNLSKYLSPQVWESIFFGRKTVKLESQRKKLTLFFSDIKGFTSLSEELEPEALTELLNHYLTEMSCIALEHGGTIDKFAGDSVIVFFGDPGSKGPKEDAIAAVSMALDMRKRMTVLRRQWKARGIEKPLEVRMGINTGYCTVGNFGADNRMDYTIIGQEVNLASRLESAAEAGHILISHETWSLIKDVILCQSMGEMQVKGFPRPVSTYRVLDFRRNMGTKENLIEFEIRGFSMSLDLDSIDPYEKKRILKSMASAAIKLKVEEPVE